MKNKKENKKERKLNDDEIFEVELFNSLAFYGYLFPKSIKEVDRFEELYGNTEIDTPAIIELPTNKVLPNFQENKNIEMDLSLNKAAFRSKRNDSFDLPEDKSKKDSD